MKNPTVNLSDKDQKHLVLDWEEKCSYVTQLIVPKNTIKGFPEELAKMTKLEVLDISNNRFTSLLAASTAPKEEEKKEGEEEGEKKEEEDNNTEKKESDNSPAEEEEKKSGGAEGEEEKETHVLFSLASLKSLLLAGNRLVEFGSAEHWKKLSLEKVDLENNKLSCLPLQLTEVGESLASLNLGRNCLEVLPEEISQLCHLERLLVPWNGLSSIPEALCSLKYVQELNLSHNQLSSIPSAIGGMEALVKLDLSFNKITAVPTEVGTLAYLAVLNLRENCIESLAEELFLDENFAVEEVNLQQNRLQTLPESLWAIDTITSLSLSSNKLQELPPALGQLVNLQTLLVADNCLTAIPEEIGELQLLTELSLAWNKLPTLPDSIGTLASMRTLNVSYNELSELPELDGCDSLYELWVTGNSAITTLPASVFSRQRLGKVYASMLQLTSLPDELGDLEELEVLDVAYNAIEALPDCLGELQILRRINACRNRLKDLPSLSQCYDLQNIDLSYNAFTAPPEEMEQFLERGVEVLFDGNPLEEPLAEAVAEEVLHIHASSRFPVAGIADMIGKRPTMEDAMAVRGDFPPASGGDFYGLYDGHAGRETATFCGKHVHEVMVELQQEKGLAPLEALVESYPETNRRFKAFMYSDDWAGQSKYCGTTAVSVLIDSARMAHVVNVGDSRAVLCRGGAPLRLSFDHKPYSDEEQDRIRALGGCVAGDTGRVNGLLAVSRSIGDFYMHPFVTDKPFQGQYQLQDDDEKLILACDGVWDEVSDERAVEIVMAEKDPFLACAKLRDFAYALGSDDNISVMIVHLKEQ